ncbi:MAG: (2Fe-2S)-binding protein [Deltaproteobacteria bacterium]|nr:(2Fe-2S)-binding protein [Deltaproteobacteria bacterium]
MSEETKQVMVTVTIDGQEKLVPQGSNLIEAARQANITIPHYCYHKHLSIAGNCRMCQVKIEGQPKLTIACNTTVTEGMKVSTHHTSAEVAEAQRATLEFLLINHPLDCTVCDQAGQCKLQDYFYQYDIQPSRFTEHKEHKMKATPLGPEVIYDAERCIVCTRCVRFCKEVTKSAELGVFQRGDRSYIGVVQGAELNNPLSGTVADLCPVGALTHRRWRFNTRIWNTTITSTVCAGCSNGCNCEVAVRDNQVVQVKGKLTSQGNKGWMCDEGRYGFMRFEPERRLAKPMRWNGSTYELVKSEQIVTAIKTALFALKANSKAALFLSPYLTKEELAAALDYAQKAFQLAATSEQISLSPRPRAVSELEAILIASDYAPNIQAACALNMVEQSSDWRTGLNERYLRLLKEVKDGKYAAVCIIGDYAINADQIDAALVVAVRGAEFSLQLGVREDEVLGSEELAKGTPAIAKFVLPALTVNERSGIFINRLGREQKIKQLLTAPDEAKSEADWLKSLAE